MIGINNRVYRKHILTIVYYEFIGQNSPSFFYL